MYCSTGMRFFRGWTLVIRGPDESCRGLYKYCYVKNTGPILSCIRSSGKLVFHTSILMYNARVLVLGTSILVGILVLLGGITLQGNYV